MAGAIETSRTHCTDQTSLIWPAEHLGLSETDKKIIEFFYALTTSDRSRFVCTAVFQESKAYKRKIVGLKLEDGTRIYLPRSIYATQNYFILALNGHNNGPTLRGGGQESKLKLAYDPVLGKYFVKKHIHSTAQMLIINNFLFQSKGFGDQRGVAEIGYAEKEIYFEAKYDQDLFQNSKSNLFNVNLSNLLDIQNALMQIHSLTFHPPRLSRLGEEGRLCSAFELGGPCFHGDLSPQNILCSFSDGEKYPEYKLTDFGFSCRFDRIAWTPGWASPEYIAFADQDNPKYKGMSNSNFNAKYGRKRDVWALGLLFGSLLRGGFHPDVKNSPIPNFSFIANKITFVGGRFVETKLAELTQKEIDDKISEFVAELDIAKPVEKTQANFWKVINQWLTVDPDKRPNLAEAHLVPIYTSAFAYQTGEDGR